LTLGKLKMRLTAVSPDIDDNIVEMLTSAAWESRNRAHIHGTTRVGCAAVDEEGRIFGGCNIEHRYRSHDVHAEVNAISSLVSGGGLQLRAVLIAAERDRFTPCGSCMDWIFELGGEDCIVLSQSQRGGEVKRYKASELMPYYPH
jgi:cytidine deaminase